MLKNPYLILKFVGTDAYLMQGFLPYMSWRWKLKTIAIRWIVKFLDSLIEHYILDHENLERHLRKAGLKKPCKVIPNPVKFPEKFDKVKHSGFNIVYYNPSGRKKNKKSIQWLYGIDLIKIAKEHFPDANWIEVDGTANMAEIWPIADMYVRPNRADGASRMRQECDINDIPYYWTFEKPNIFDLVGAIHQVRNKVLNRPKRIVDQKNMVV